MHQKTAIILMNTGSPDAPTPEAVRRYLEQFLSDRRIIDLPRIFWWPILYGVILRNRPAKSAARYQSIWTKEGSPLIVTMQKITNALQARLDCPVRMAMRYGNPSVEKTLSELQKEGFNDFLIFPLFAQYASETVEACVDAVKRAQEKLPSFTYRLVPSYYNRAQWVDALIAEINERRTQGHHLLMSFHGIPVKSIEKGSPYETQCQESAKSLANALGLKDGEWTIAFQSKFGGGKWLSPYLDDQLDTLLGRDVTEIDVVSLSFSCDCLETLEELAIDTREQFLKKGGKTLNVLPCLNDSPAAINLYESCIREQF